MRRFLWDWRQTGGQRSGAEAGTGGRRGGSRGAVGPVRGGSTRQQPLRRFCPDAPGPLIARALQPGALRRLELATALPLGERRLWGAGSRTHRRLSPQAALAAESARAVPATGALAGDCGGGGTEAGPPNAGRVQAKGSLLLPLPVDGGRALGRPGPVRGSLFSPGSGWARLSLARRSHKPRMGRSSPYVGSDRGATSSCPPPAPTAGNVGMLQGGSGGKTKSFFSAPFWWAKVIAPKQPVGGGRGLSGPFNEAKPSCATPLLLSQFRTRDRPTEASVRLFLRVAQFFPS